MMGFFRTFLKNETGVAGAEMALMVPLLMTIMFGSFELGHYFWTEHKLIKSVRDAARFAARQPGLYSPDCVAGVVTAVPAPDIDKVARYGKLLVVTGDKTIIPGWTDAVEVQLDCPAIGSYAGIYTSKTSVPIVSVSATVDYPSLFEDLGFGAANIEVSASSQAAVMGL